MTCMMNYEIATPRQVAARNDHPYSVVARHNSAEAISGGEILNAKHQIRKSVDSSQ
jgi:hypothetical protein